MPKSIVVEVKKDGSLAIELTGFEGETCFDESQTLEEIMRGLGLKSRPVNVIKKSPEVIRVEAGLEEPERKKVPH